MHEPQKRRVHLVERQHALFDVLGCRRIPTFPAVEMAVPAFASLANNWARETARPPEVTGTCPLTYLCYRSTYERMELATVCRCYQGSAAPAYLTAVRQTRASRPHWPRARQRCRHHRHLSRQHLARAICSLATSPRMTASSPAWTSGGHRGDVLCARAYYPRAGRTTRATT